MELKNIFKKFNWKTGEKKPELVDATYTEMVIDKNTVITIKNL